MYSSKKSFCPPVYDPLHNRQEIIDSLQNKGYVAINVMTNNEVDDIASGFWDWLEQLGTGLKRNDVTTIDICETWPEQTKGIINMYGIGQAEFMWRARIHPNIIHVFKDIWNNDSLITSFDGACMFPLAPGFILESHEEHKEWLHRDQSPLVNERMCVQGALQLYDNLSEEDGGFIVWPKSHLIDWTTRDPRAKRIETHWYRVGRVMTPLEKEKCVILRVPKGTLILWDSRTIHENIQPTIFSRNPRAALLICMMPREYASHTTLSKRYECFITKKTTTHLPNSITICPNTLSRYSNNKVNPENIVISSKSLPDNILSDVLNLV